MRRTIYLDTVLWNKLYEESVDPSGLVTSLRSNGAELVLSPHLRYDPARQEREGNLPFHRRLSMILVPGECLDSNQEVNRSSNSCKCFVDLRSNLVGAQA